MANHEVTDELRKIYEDAGNEGIWLHELGPCDNGFLAGAGWVSKIEAIEAKTGKEIDLTKISLYDVMHLTEPGDAGATREDACRNAIAALKAADSK